MILPTAYLGSIGWYKLWLSEPREHNLIEIWESFPKQTMRNRCFIAGTNGAQMLSVPVVKCESKQLTKDVRISYEHKWQHQHWQALQSAYRHTPFFDYFEDFFRPLYARRFDFLIDLNYEMHNAVCKLLGVDAELLYTPDWKGAIEPKLSLENQKQYYQIFADKNGFQTDLSIVDLLFNMGTEAPLYL